MLEKNDFESISNSGSTRYGSSMRTSSLDSRSAGPFRNGQQPSGSDGFAKFTQSSDFNMQNTFIKHSEGMTTGPQGFNATSNTFKR